MSKFGYLRQDQDHWYLVPEDLVKRFDYVSRVIEDDEGTVSDDDDMIKLFISEFSKYRLSGGCYDLKIPMEDK